MKLVGIKAIIININEYVDLTAHTPHDNLPKFFFDRLKKG